MKQVHNGADFYLIIAILKDDIVAAYEVYAQNAHLQYYVKVRLGSTAQYESLRHIII